MQVAHLLGQAGDGPGHLDAGHDVRDGQGQDGRRADSQLGEPGAACSVEVT